MKIETKKMAGKDAVVVKFTEGTVSKFVEKDGVSELYVWRVSKEILTLSRRKAVLFLRKVVAVAKQNKIKSLSLAWSDVRTLVAEDVTDVMLGEILAIAFVMADFEFVVYKKKPSEGFAFIDTIFVQGASAEAISGIRRGEIVGAEINGCRSLANIPGGDMTPKKLVTAAKVAVKGTTITVKVLGEKEMLKLGMGAILGVGRGSEEESQFIIMEYKGNQKSPQPHPNHLLGQERGKDKRPLVLVGKGVTFDTGGLSLKPSDSMTEMHMDMSGGAAVIHTIALAAKLKLSIPIVALIPAVENMPSGSATRPCDILKSMSGRTIEVLNTDAEGRVILADAITYAKKYNPRAVVECSTLTGASLVALGMQASAVMATDETLRNEIVKLGEESGDYVWPFPLWEEYEEMIKSDFADVANIPSGGNSRRAGVIGGGMFLAEFAKDLSCPFAHIDIAPRMTATSGEHLSKGAAGAPVRLLLAIAENMSDKIA